MRRKEKLVCGVGINDLDRVVYQKRAGVINVCPVYKVWKSMLVRCYSPKYYYSERYMNCFVVEDWLTLSRFEEWMLNQAWHDRELDKDILIKGNKIYSPDTCVFIDQRLNKFLIESEAIRGEYPIGVCWKSKIGKYVAQCNNPFEDDGRHLGTFDTAEEAHRAWKLAKHKYALRFADMQDDTRVAEALRNRYI